MLIIGISGGIASGKNLICDIFLQYKSKVFDADKITHNLLNNDLEIIKKISQNFPECLIGNKIERKILADLIFSNPNQFFNKIKTIEEIIHPKIRQSYQEFVEKNKSDDDLDFLVLNIPLLLENSFYKYDKLIAIKCDKETRQKRYLSRFRSSQDLISQNSESNNLNEIDLVKSIKKFDIICARQLDDGSRIKNADHVIDNNHSIFSTIKQAKSIILQYIS